MRHLQSAPSPAASPSWTGGDRGGRPAERFANRAELKPLRQDLRNHATQAERALWQALKGRRLAGRKFRRQHSIGRYILDFYCPRERLAIEIDGQVHDDPARGEYDSVRQRELEELGIRVLRFSNDDVLRTCDLVVEAVGAAVRAGEATTPSPSWPGGGLHRTPATAARL